MFLVAYTGARTNSFSADWKPTAFFKSTSPQRSECADGPFDYWCMKFGIAHHTTGQFRKGSNRNTAAIADEMPFGSAFCLAMISTDCRR